MSLTKYNKAYVPTAVGILFFVLGHFGVSPSMSLSDLVYFLLASFGVYTVENK